MTSLCWGDLQPSPLQVLDVWPVPWDPLPSGVVACPDPSLLQGPAQVPPPPSRQKALPIPWSSPTAGCYPKSDSLAGLALKPSASSACPAALARVCTASPRSSAPLENGDSRATLQGWCVEYVKVCEEGHFVSHTPNRILSWGLGLKSARKSNTRDRAPWKTLGLPALPAGRQTPLLVPRGPRLVLQCLYHSCGPASLHLLPDSDLFPVSGQRNLKAGHLFFPAGVAARCCLGGFTFLFGSGHWGIEWAVSC